MRGVLSLVIVTTTLFSGVPPVDAIERLSALGLAGDRSRTDALTRLLLEVYAGGGFPRSRLSTGSARTTTRRWPVGRCSGPRQARENAGDIEGAIVAANRGLTLCDDSDGPWTRALFEAQATGLATQAGDWDEAVAHASRAIPVMQALGALEDVLQLRSTLAFADIAAGRLDEAATQIEAIVSDERGQLGGLEHRRPDRGGRAGAGPW